MTSIQIPTTAIELRGTSPRSAFALNGLRAILFGATFVAAGCGIGAVAWLASADGIHAPRAIVAIVGLTFAIAGAWVAMNGVLDVYRRRDAAQRAAAMPRQPWWWDYAWRADGIGNDTPREIGKAFGIALFLAIFLTPFHWIGIVQRAWPFAIGALLFDIVIVAMLVRAVRLVLMRRRYGASWLRFRRFPFHPGECVETSLDAFGALGALPSLAATLRCVQERYEERGTGDDRSTQVICYALWSATMTAERSRKGTFDILFELPADVATCALSERPARFWELELKSDDVPGVDYVATFLIPVYRRDR